ncbi:hypothetical protein ACIRJO_39100 [Streptomyces sp. NPDC102394]|uniref:hypothetical protein n=1 Tax=Streptomyces sp. NPDC102394 TaxID=3366167 RepID=UPI00381D26FE
MTLPGFTADHSIYRSPRPYRTRGSSPTAGAGRNSVLPQQDAVCCGKYCSGLCSCQGGHGYCSPAVKEEAYGNRALLQATDSVGMALDACHASEPINGAQAFAVCENGCWATKHDAGCL